MATKETKRAWHITVYDYKGDQIDPDAVEQLDNFATLIAQQYNLVIERAVE